MKYGHTKNSHALWVSWMLLLLWQLQHPPWTNTILMDGRRHKDSLTTLSGLTCVMEGWAVINRKCDKYWKKGKPRQWERSTHLFLCVVTTLERTGKCWLQALSSRGSSRLSFLSSRRNPHFHPEEWRTGLGQPLPIWVFLFLNISIFPLFGSLRLHINGAIEGLWIFVPLEEVTVST